MKLYVGNIDYGTTENGLEGLFSNYGDVKDVAVITDRQTGQSRGFAFVTMDDQGANEAIDALNGDEFEGRRLTVNQARPKGSGGGDFRGGSGW